MAIQKIGDEADVTAWSNVWWGFDIFTLKIPDTAKITLLKAMEHYGEEVINEHGDRYKSYPSTAWLVEQRGLTPQTIRRHTRQIRKALGGLW